MAGINYNLRDAIRKPLIMSIIISCLSLLSTYIRVTFSNLSAERQIRTIRKDLFRSILEKDIAFFDKHQTGELMLHLTDNVNKIANGIRDKLTSATEMISTFLICFIIGNVFLIIMKNFIDWVK